MGWRALAVLGALTAVSAAGAAQPAAGRGATEMVEKVQAACAGARDVSARFHQTASNRSLGQVQEASGTLLLKRPGKMRWEYQKPDPRLYVTDGKTLWAYNPQDQQVLLQDVEQAFASRLPLSFLAGDCRLGKEFQIALVEHAGTKASPATALLELKPRAAGEGAAGIERMILEVDRSSGLVQKATLFDAVGNTTVIALSDVQVNAGAPDDKFTFTPPPGTRVVKPGGGS
jgi:outer membrane lipoprotein carrier protein